MTYVGYELKLGQKIKLALFGDVKIDRLNKGHGFVDIYLFKCSKHDWVIDYPHGHCMKLVCPKCTEEELRRTLSPDVYNLIYSDSTQEGNR
jgi:hypothetical protein